MKKYTKWIFMAFALSGAAFIAFNFFLDAKKKDCQGGSGAQAIEACTFLIGKHTSGFKGPYLLRRAQLLEKEGKWDEVLADLNELLAINVAAQLPPAQLLAVYESLIKVQSRKGSSAETRKYLELAVQNGSRSPEIYISLAETYMAEKKFQEALNLLETAGAFEGAKNHPYYNTQASAYEGLNDFTRAYDSLKAGLTVRAPRPVLAATSKHLGLVCFELKRYKEAETYLGYTIKAGLECPECALLMTTIRGALAEYDVPAPRVKKARK